MSPSLSSFPTASPLRCLPVWALLLIGVYWMRSWRPDHQPDDQILLFTLSVAACAWWVGFFCDRLPVPRWLRIAAVFVLAYGAALYVTSFGAVKAPFSIRFVPLGDLAIPLTTLWIFVVTYAFFGTNLLPGLTLGLSGVIAPTLFLVGCLQPQNSGALASVLVTPLAGLSLGQLRSIRSPTAKRLDSGTALAVGMVLAIITVSGALKNTAFLVLLFPILVLGAPLLNITYAVFRREKMAGEPDSPVSVGVSRVRLHDALLREGVTPRRVVSLLIAVEVYLCALAVLLVVIIRAHFALKFLLLLPWMVIGFLFFFALSKMFGRRAAVQPGRSVNLLNVSITPVSMSEAMDKVEAFIASRKPHMIVTSDTSIIVRAQDDPEFFNIVNEADMVTADGIGVVLSARLLNLPIFERVSGVDMVEGMCRLSSEKGYRIFFLGAAPGIAEEAARQLGERYPGLVIAGTHHGYFKDDEEEQVVEAICQSEADMLFVAFGIPRQEKFIRRYMDRMQVPVCIGVGGSLDVYAGTVKRAPAWLQRMGLEWLYRTALQPKRIGRLTYIPRLLILTFKHLLTSPANSTQGPQKPE